MKTAIIVWSVTSMLSGVLTLAGPPAWAESGQARPKLIAEASHTVLSPDDAAKAAAEKAPAAKPTTPRAPASTASAADRILRRLDEAFPYKASGAVRPAETHRVTRASHRATLTVRISLRWPEEIAPRSIR